MTSSMSDVERDGYDEPSAECGAGDDDLGEELHGSHSCCCYGVDNAGANARPKALCAEMVCYGVETVRRRARSREILGAQYCGGGVVYWRLNTSGIRIA